MIVIDENLTSPIHETIKLCYKNAIFVLKKINGEKIYIQQNQNKVGSLSVKTLFPFQMLLGVKAKETKFL